MALFIIRFVLLGALGLGGMYMMHLLAQDFDRIRQPVAKAAGALLSSASGQLRSRREIGVTQRTLYHFERQLLRHRATAASSTSAMPSIDWKRILSRDPFECLQSLICQLMAGSEDSETREALVIMELLESSLALAPAKIGRAFSRGLASRGSAQLCYDEYPFCLYSAKTMFRVLHWFAHDAPDGVE